MREVVMVISNGNQTVSAYETVDAVKKAGFKSVFTQWYDRDWNPSQESQLKYTKEQGLNVIFSHLGYDGIDNIWKDGIEGEKLKETYINDIKAQKEKYGIDLFILHLTDKYEYPDNTEIGLRRIKEIVDYAESINVRIAFENTKVRGDVDYILDNLDNKNIGLCFDSGHYHAFFHDDMDFSKYKDRIFAVHLHDNDESEDQHLIPFDGTIDWESIVKYLKECNYSGPITIESCYRNQYLNMSIDEYCAKCYEVAQKIREMFNDN